jgi:anion-transporting  ArsA/GET3 family ATPase
MVPLLERRLLFVTGKGGVGKTTVAAAIALFASEHGRRTLLCESDARGDVASCFETGPTSFTPREVLPDLWAMSMDKEASLREYLRLNLRIPVFGRIGPLAKAFDFVATAAPGVAEILVVGKFCYEVRERHYDLVVVDASSTGHIDLVKVGLIRLQTDWMLHILSDPASTGVVVVSTPEEMPVSETLQLAGLLEEQTTVELASVVVNQVLPELFGRTEEEIFEQLHRKGTAADLGRSTGGDVRPVLEAARLAVTLRRTGAGHLERLRAGIDANVPLLYLPFLFTKSDGVRTVRKMARSLGDELGF